MPRQPARRGGGDRRRASRPPTNRQYPRTARLNALLQQIVADHLERVDDERLGFLTVTGVEVDNDLNRAEVFISAIGGELDRPDGDSPSDEADAQYLEVLEEYRKPIQADIATQTRIRKTPEVVFAFDPGVRTGARIEEILAGLDRPAAGLDPVEGGADGTDPDSADSERAPGTETDEQR